MLEVLARGANAGGGSRCTVHHEFADCFRDHHVIYGVMVTVYIAINVSLRDTLLSAAQSPAMANWKEVPSLIPGANSHPADLYFPCCKHGKPAALDVTIISPLQKLTIHEASVTQWHNLSVADGGSEPHIKVFATPICCSVDTIFDKEAEVFLKRIGESLAVK